jgi:hypothetical protein
VRPYDSLVLNIPLEDYFPGYFQKAFNILDSLYLNEEHWNLRWVIKKGRVKYSLCCVQQWYIVWWLLDD